jgi:ABC-type glycerol-3-phosphate transport system substrate-binding protein
MPSFAGLAEAEKALNSAMQSAVLGKMPPKDALAAAAKRAQAVVDEFNF